MAACLCLLSAHSHLLVIFLKGYHTTIFTIHNYSLIQLPVFSHYYKKNLLNIGLEEIEKL